VEGRPIVQEAETAVLQETHGTGHFLQGDDLGWAEWQGLEHDRANEPLFLCAKHSQVIVIIVIAVLVLGTIFGSIITVIGDLIAGLITLIFEIIAGLWGLSCGLLRFLFCTGMGLSILGISVLGIITLLAYVFK